MGVIERMATQGNLTFVKAWHEMKLEERKALKPDCDTSEQDIIIDRLTEAIEDCDRLIIENQKMKHELEEWYTIGKGK